MKIHTFSIVVGTRACNAHCPFCVSKMTGFEAVAKHTSFINELNFTKACKLAVMAQTSTVLLTGKGEPTLYPHEISQYLALLVPWNFPFIELQTNGLTLGRLAEDRRDGLPKGLNEATLIDWRNRGLNTIALSVVDAKNWNNAVIYNMDYPDLAATVGYLHTLGFTVRLCVMMLKGYVDSVERVKEMIDFCRRQSIKQLTIRPIRKPKKANHNDAVSEYVLRHGLEPRQEKAIYQWCLRKEHTRLMTLSHGAVVLDVHGQNLCVSDCLNETGNDDDIRTLIFYPDGSLRYRWDYDGAVLLRGSD